MSQQNRQLSMADTAYAQTDVTTANFVGHKALALQQNARYQRVVKSATKEGETITGSHDNDQLSSTYDNVTLNGGNGDDILKTSANNNILNGGKGADSYSSTGSNNTLYIDNINDSIDYSNKAVNLVISVDKYKVQSINGEGDVKYGTIRYADGVQKLEYFIDAVDSGNREGFLLKDKNIWQGYGHGITIKYAFATQADGGEKGLISFNQQQQNDISIALKEFSKVADISFQKVTDPSQADMKFYFDDLSSGVASSTEDVLGYAGFGGNVHINTEMHNFDGAFTKTDKPHYGKGDGVGYDTIVHEFGHVLGLKHSGNYGGTDVATLPKAEENFNYSIMSYKEPDKFNWKVVGLSVFDIATLHYKFGVNHKARTGNDAYDITKTIYVWDGAGTDALLATNATDNAYINLNAGSWNYIGKKADLLSAGNQSFLGYDTHIEKAWGGKYNDTIIGNALDNKVQGGDGNDLIKGGNGDDVLFGQNGNDTLKGDNGKDILVGANGDDKLYGGDGIDRLYGGDGADQLYGGNGKDTLQGGDGNDSLNGGNGDDTLFGENGKDTLNGGNGNDWLIGGSGSDTFIFNDNLSANNIDKIPDFVSMSDVLHLDNTIFTSLNEGQLQSNNFTANNNGQAQDSNDYIIYNTTTGQLSYDADGNGAGQSHVFAILTNKAELTYNDIVIM